MKLSGMNVSKQMRKLLRVLLNTTTRNGHWEMQVIESISFWSKAFKCRQQSKKLKRLHSESWIQASIRWSPSSDWLSHQGLSYSASMIFWTKLAKSITTKSTDWNAVCQRLLLCFSHSFMLLFSTSLVGISMMLKKHNILELRSESNAKQPWEHHQEILPRHYATTTAIGMLVEKDSLAQQLILLASNSGLKFKVQKHISVFISTK